MPRRTTNIDMTQGAITSQLMAYAVPLLLGDFLQQLYNTADSVIVGNFVGKEALAAVGATAHIVNVLIGLFTGISTGATVVISQHFGARRQAMLNLSVRTTLWMTVCLGGLFTLLGVAGTPLMLRLLGTPADVYPSAELYLRIFFAGISGLILYNMCSGILRAVGDSHRPLYVLIFCCVLNIALDCLFVIGLSAGVAGVAVATVVSQFLSAGVLLYLLEHMELFGALRLRSPCMDRGTLRTIMGIGLPIGIRKSIIAFSNTIVVSYINKFESGAMAAWSIYIRMDQLITHTSQSLSVAVTTFVAQNLGARKPERIRKGVRASVFLALGTTAFYAVIFSVFRYPIIRLFNREEDVLYYGALTLLLLPPAQFINSVAQVGVGALQGEGRSKAPMVIMVTSYALLRQLYLYIGWPHAGSFLFVIMSYPFSWVICCALVWGYMGWLAARSEEPPMRTDHTTS